MLAWLTPPIKLVVYSSDESAVIQEIGNDEDGKRLFRTGITQVKQNGNGDYVVVDLKRIVCVSSEGRFRWEYSVEIVYGMVCDKYDNVIIAEFNNDKILLLSSEGKLVTTLLTLDGGISKPRSLSIDRHGQLWIGHVHSLKVFRYLKWRCNTHKNLRKSFVHLSTLFTSTITRKYNMCIVHNVIFRVTNVDMFRFPIMWAYNIVMTMEYRFSCNVLFNATLWIQTEYSHSLPESKCSSVNFPHFYCSSLAHCWDKQWYDVMYTPSLRDWGDPTEHLGRVLNVILR